MKYPQAPQEPCPVFTPVPIADSTTGEGRGDGENLRQNNRMGYLVGGDDCLLESIGLFIQVKLTAADKKWAKLIKSRAEYRCERCGKWHGEKSMGLHAAHIFSRRFKATRHDPENGIALDFGCHMWAHRNPLDGHEFFKEYLGEERYEALKKRAKALKK